MPDRRLPSCVVFVAALMALLATAPAPAQPLADHVPADAIAYVGWAGLDADGVNYAGSRFATVVQATDLATKLDLALKDLSDPAAGAELISLEAMVLLGGLREAEGIYLRRPWAMYLRDVPAIEDHFELGVVIDPGDADRQTIRRLLQTLGKLVATLEDEVAIEAEGEGENELIRLTVAPPQAQRPDAPLADADRFADAMREAGPSSLYTLYLEADATARSVLAAQPDNETLPEVFETLGLTELRSVVALGGFTDAGDWASRFAIRSTGEPVMVLNLLGGEPITNEDLALTPRSAVWMRSFRLDVGGAIDRVVTLVDQFQPGARQQFDDTLAQGSAALDPDINLQADLIDGLGDLWVMYTDPELGEGRLGAHGALVTPLGKPDRVEAVIAAAMDYVNHQVRRVGDPSVQLFEDDVDGNTVYSVALRKFSIGISVAEGRLHISTEPDQIQRVIQQANADESILDNETFQAIRDRLEIENPTSLRFADLEQTARPFYEGTRSGLDDFAMSFQSPRFNAAITRIPSLEPIEKQLAPAGAAMRFDGQAWVGHEVGPMPGAATLSPESMTRLSTMFGPLGLPTMLYMPIEMSNPHWHIRNKLGNLGLVAQNLGHQGEVILPDSLHAAMVSLEEVTFNIEMTLVFYPGREKPLPDDWDAKTDKEKDRWLRRKAFFVYLGDGEKLADLENLDQHVLAFTRPEHAQDGEVPVLFADGLVNSIELNSLNQTLREQTGQTMQQLINEADLGALGEFSLLKPAENRS